MKTRTQSVIVAGTLMGVLLILVLALTSINYLVSLRNKIDIINQRDLAKVVVLHKMGRIVRERSLRMYAMYVSKDIWVRDEEYQRFYSLGRDFIQLRSELMRLGLQPQERVVWEKGIAIIRATEPLQESIVEKLYVGDSDGIGEKISQEDLPQENQLLQHFDQLLHMVQAETGTAVKQAEQQFINAIRLLVLISVGVISLSLTNMFFVRKRILTIEGTLHEEKELAQLTLENVVDGVIKTDKDGRLVSMNPSAEHISGWRASDVLGKPLEEVLALVDIVSGERLSWPTFLTDLAGTVMPIQRYFELRQPAGDVCLIEISVSPIFTSAGSLMEFAFIFRDVTSEKKQADAVSWQATHDSLTQVLNRNAIIAAIKEAVATARQYNEQHIMLYIDLDDFKHVNDQYGHVAGDELLIGICREMEQCVRKGDRIARMGGDEFAILLQECDLSHAVNIAEKVRHNVARHCFEFDGQRICCSGLSIGINIINAQTRDWKIVIEQADQACYTAKRQGKNQVCVA
jgi:diguanylate cyclase (GGDEF)-like protein/PAS domain S-box-containing protein